MCSLFVSRVTTGCVCVCVPSASAVPVCSYLCLSSELLFWKILSHRSQAYMPPSVFFIFFLAGPESESFCSSTVDNPSEPVSGFSSWRILQIGFNNHMSGISREVCFTAEKKMTQKINKKTRTVSMSFGGSEGCVIHYSSLSLDT